MSTESKRHNISVQHSMAERGAFGDFLLLLDSSYASKIDRRYVLSNDGAWNLSPETVDDL